MNEMGLVANALYLSESDYGSIDNGKPTLTIVAWVHYVLDNYATVAEAVEALSAEPFRLVSPILPNGRAAQLHLAVSDPTGDSAIFEYIGGKLVIHHGKEYKVLTNSPTYDEQLAINAYWRDISPFAFQPGTVKPADRFVRASTLINGIPKQADPHFISAVPGSNYNYQAVASVLSVMRAVGVPFGFNHPDLPHVSTTIWRTVYDQKNKVFFFDSASSPNAFWVPFTDLDFSKGAHVRKLTIAGGKVYSGNAASKFELAEPYPFMPAETK